MVRDYRCCLCLIIYIFIVCSCANDECNKKENGLSEFQTNHVKLHINVISPSLTRGSLESSYCFNDKDSLRLFNISKNIDTKFVYDSTLHAFVGDLAISQDDEITVVYPYINEKVNNNVITMTQSWKTKLPSNTFETGVYWGFTNVDSNTNDISLSVYNITSSANFVFVDSDKRPISISKISLFVNKGGFYSRRQLNIRTGSLEGGELSLTSPSFIGKTESSFDDGLLKICFFPTSVAIDFSIEDVKGNIFQSSLLQKSWNETTSTIDTIECNLVQEFQSYVDVCGTKWAMGNLQYNKFLRGDKGFVEHWKLADHQYDYYNPNYGNVSDSAIWDPNRQDRFNWGAVGDKVLEISNRGRVKDSAIDISGKMYLWESKYGFMRPDLETTDFEKAEFGDLCYWASHGKYRLPTRDEMYTLYAQASCAFGFAKDEDGNLIRGALFFTPKGKREVVTTRRVFSSKDLKNGVFLPGAGFRQCGEGVVLRTGQGFYWNSFQDSEDNGIFSLRYINTVLYWSKDGSHYGRSMRPVLCN